MLFSLTAVWRNARIDRLGRGASMLLFPPQHTRVRKYYKAVLKSDFRSFAVEAGVCSSPLKHHDIARRGGGRYIRFGVFTAELERGGASLQDLFVP